MIIFPIFLKRSSVFEVLCVNINSRNIWSCAMCLQNVVTCAYQLQKTHEMHQMQMWQTTWSSPVKMFLSSGQAGYSNRQQRLFGRHLVCTCNNHDRWPSIQLTFPRHEHTMFTAFLQNWSCAAWVYVMYILVTVWTRSLEETLLPEKWWRLAQCSWNIVIKGTT